MEKICVCRRHASAAPYIKLYLNSSQAFVTNSFPASLVNNWSATSQTKQRVPNYWAGKKPLKKATSLHQGQRQTYLLNLNFRRVQAGHTGQRDTHMNTNTSRYLYRKWHEFVMYVITLLHSIYACRSLYTQKFSKENHHFLSAMQL